jgi:hypothetical protein
MGYLIGTDEAGYGPNFGPLVVSATVWHVAGSPRGVDLYRRLGSAVTPDGNGDAASGAVWIADSKAVYRAGQGLTALERGVYAALSACLGRPRGWRDLWPALTGQPAPTFATDPCCADFHCELPLAVAPDEIERAAATVDGAMRAAGVRLHAVRSRAIFAREFNQLVVEHGGKGAALSHVTTELVGEALDRLDGDHHRGGNFAADNRVDGSVANDSVPEPAWIVCDKHGGRNRYGPLLQQRFPETLIEVRAEGRARSVYRWRRGGQAVEAHFCAGGERHLPVALASMVSKYLREVAMLAFNRFWSQRLPDLRPTAGYPSDAHRFRREIAKAQRELGMEDGVLWRAR